MAQLIRNLLILLCALLPKYIDTYSNGKVTSVCGSMILAHSSSPQTSDPPFLLVSSKNTYSRGEKITVNLSITATVMIKGFLIQARTTNDTIVGSFEINNPDAQTLDCTNPADAVSQTGSASKSNVQVTWKAPNVLTGNITLRATVVRGERTYWTNVISRALTYSNANSTATGVNGTATSSQGSHGFRLYDPFTFGLMLIILSVIASLFGI